MKLKQLFEKSEEIQLDYTLIDSDKVYKNIDELELQLFKHTPENKRNSINADKDIKQVIKDLLKNKVTMHAFKSTLDNVLNKYRKLGAEDTEPKTEIATFMANAFGKNEKIYNFFR